MALLLAISSVSRAEGGLNTMCPVTPDEEANPKITATYEGQTVALCCKSCLRKFNANPEAYIAALSDGGHNGSQLPEAPRVVAQQSDSVDGTAEHTHSHDDAHGAPASESSPHIEAETGHDHTKDHGDAEHGTAGDKLLSYLGRYHVLAVHLPIGLLSLAALAELAGWMRRRDNWLSFGRSVFVFGALGAFVASGLGWLAAREASYPGDLAAYLEWHRWWGTSVSFFALLGLLSLLGKRSGLGWCDTLYRVMVLALAIMVPVTAHLGGSLIYGPEYLF